MDQTNVIHIDERDEIEPIATQEQTGTDRPEDDSGSSTIARLRKLEDVDIGVLVETLLDPNFGLRQLLDDDHLSDDVLICLVSLLCETANARDGTSTHAFAVMSLFNAVLSSQLVTRHVPAFLQRSGIKYGAIDTTVMEKLVQLFQLMLDRFPARASESLGVALLACRDALECSPDEAAARNDKSILEVLQSLEETRRAVLGRYDSATLQRVTRSESVQVQHPPPDNFRLMSVTITADDVHHVVQPYLRPNVVDGRFMDIEHYLDVHFRLLREDFVAPLRDGLDNLLSSLAIDPTRDVQKIGHDAHIRIYTDVHVDGFECNRNDGIVYRLRFNMRGLRRIDWDSSKRLINGSMVCLSSDNFVRIRTAVIVGGEPAELKRGLLMVKLVNDDFYDTNSEVSFTMVESPTYFQAYEPVLRVLQSFRSSRMPFQRYFVECNGNLLTPRYLRANTRYNLGCLLKRSPNDVGDKRSPNDVGDKRSPNDVGDKFFDLDEWPAADSFGLDDAQYAALRMALTKELAIIQGPPGTGKTFLGLKIVEAMLANEIKWRNSDGKKNPILVICYTNQALDQFLEGILKFLPVDCLDEFKDECDCDDDEGFCKCHRREYQYWLIDYVDDILPMARVGGQSKSLAVDRYRLNSVRNEYRKIWTSKLERKQNFGLREQLTIVETKIKEREQIIRMSKVNMLRETALAACMKIEHQDQLVAMKETLTRRQSGSGSNVSAIADWLEMADFIFEMDEPPTQQTLSERNLQKDKEDGPDDAAYQSDEEYSDDDKFSLKIRRKKEMAVKLDKYFVGSVHSGGSTEELWHVQRGSRRRLRKKFAENIAAGDAMLPLEAQAVTNIWQLTLADRWRLYRYWLLRLRENCLFKISTLKDRYMDINETLKAAQRRVDIRILRSAKVIGMTTSGAAKNNELLQMIQPRIVIVEEAAEVLEAHIITALTENCEHLILIGDHQQLRPNPSVYKLATKYHLDVSLFERLIRNGVPHVTLTQQHRMRPEISSLLVPHIYANLADHESVQSRAHVAGVGANVFFLNHDHEESDVADSTSHANEFEARFVLALANYIILQDQYGPDQITILTTYVGQLNLINRLRNQNYHHALSEVSCKVVDNYQGEENDIIILSLVRNNEDGSVGFLKVNNRVCVALSRARDGLYCIGNFDRLAQASPLWRNIGETLRGRPTAGMGDQMPIACQLHPETANAVINADDFAHLAPDGGCKLGCQSLLACGLHKCILSCHPYDRDHDTIKCQVTCEKILCTSGHVCGKPCHVECGKCIVLVKKSHPLCGNTVEVPCSVEPIDIVCIALVSKVLSCGHTMEVPCSSEVSELKCKDRSEIELRCGHTVEFHCGGNRSKIVCREKVKKIFECGHSNEVACCVSETVECQIRQPKVFECGHTVEALCGADQNSIVCRERVDKELSCGHTIQAPCNVNARDILCRVLTEKKLGCGHTTNALCGINTNKIICHAPTEKQLLCGHSAQTRCNAIIKDIFCQVPAEKLLKCGHTSNTVCGVDTSRIVCRILTEKILGCGHPKQAQCNVSLYSLQCMLTCTKLLSCGHPCTDICSNSCSRVQCQVQVEFTRTCGHSTMMACYEATTKTSEARQAPCEMACETMLSCGHRCGGSCNDCFGGLMHRRCNEICTRSLICGHQCPMPCWQSCPPCQKPCESRCQHGSRCELSCGMPCRLTCEVACGWQCEHYACTRLCQEPCDRPACDEACPLLLADCGHPCTGLCGEPCPPYCRICSPDCDAISNPLNEADSRLVVLEDCSHVFEVAYLDGLYSQAYVQEEEQMRSEYEEKETTGTIITMGADNQEASNGIADIEKVNAGGDTVVGMTDSIADELSPKEDATARISNVITVQNYNDVITEQLANDVKATNQPTADSSIDIGAYIADPIIDLSATESDDKELVSHTDDVTTKQDNIVMNPVEAAAVPHLEVAIMRCPRCQTPVQTSRRYGNRVKEFRASALDIKKKIFEDAVMLRQVMVKLDSKKIRPTLSPIGAQVKKEASRLRTPTEMLVVCKKICWLITIDACMSVLLKTFGTLYMMDMAWRRLYANITLSDVIAKMTGRLETYMQRHLNCRQASEAQLYEFDRELRRFTLLVRLVCDPDNGLVSSLKRLPTVRANPQPHVTVLYEHLVGNHQFSEEFEREIFDVWDAAKGNVGQSLRNAGPPRYKSIVECQEFIMSCTLAMTRGRWFRCPRGHSYSKGAVGVVGEGRCSVCESLLRSSNNEVLESI